MENQNTGRLGLLGELTVGECPKVPPRGPMTQEVSRELSATKLILLWTVGLIVSHSLLATNYLSSLQFRASPSHGLTGLWGPPREVGVSSLGHSSGPTPWELPR